MASKRWKRACAATGLSLAVAASQAAVMGLWDESVDGDLPTYTLNGGAPPVLAITTTGVSVVMGSWSYTVGSSSGDRDAFQFTVAPGLRVTGISVDYTLHNTGNPVDTFYALHRLVAAGVFSESISSADGLSGFEALFDEGAGGFVPLEASSSPREMWLAAGNGAGSPGDVWSNRYTVQITAETVGTVAEPGGAALVMTALGAAGLLGRRRSAKNPVAGAGA